MLGENAAPAIFSVDDVHAATPRRTTTASGRTRACRRRSSWSAPRAGVRRRLHRRRATTPRSRRASSRRSREYSRGDRAGPAQRARRLRHLRERAAARRAGRGHRAEALQGARFRLPARSRARPPSIAAWRSPRSPTASRAARRISARSSSARRCPSTGHALEGANHAVAAPRRIHPCWPSRSSCWLRRPWAHHGIGRFDPTRELNVEGTLTGLDFVNPHSYVHFNAVDANGAVDRDAMRDARGHRAAPFGLVARHVRAGRRDQDPWPAASRRSALLLRGHADHRRCADAASAISN